MQIRYKDYEHEDYRELEALMLALYTEDDEGEPMDRSKIKNTVEALADHPEQGRILLIREKSSDGPGASDERPSGPLDGRKLGFSDRAQAGLSIERQPDPLERTQADPSAVIGYAILVFCWNTEFGGRFVIIDDLYIRPEFRSKGIGAGFFDFLTEEYGGKAAALALEASPGNKDAIRLYERYGFEPAHNVHMMKRI